MVEICTLRGVWWRFGTVIIISYLARRSSWAYLQLEGSCKKGNVFAYRLGFVIIDLSLI